MVYLRNNNTNEVIKMDIDNPTVLIEKANPGYKVLRFLATPSTNPIMSTDRYFILVEKETAVVRFPVTSQICEVTNDTIINSKSVESGFWSGAIISDGNIIVTGWESCDPGSDTDLKAVIIKLDYNLNELGRYTDTREGILSNYLDIAKLTDGRLVCITIEPSGEDHMDPSEYQATIHLFDKDLKLINELSYEIGEGWGLSEIDTCRISGNILVKHLIPINVFGKNYQSDAENHGVEVLFTVTITPELRIVGYDEANIPF